VGNNLNLSSGASQRVAVRQVFFIKAKYESDKKNDFSNSAKCKQKKPWYITTELEFMALFRFCGPCKIKSERFGSRAQEPESNANHIPLNDKSL
jgi:hypothetical protein